MQSSEFCIDKCFVNLRIPLLLLKKKCGRAHAQYRWCVRVGCALSGDDDDTARSRVVLLVSSHWEIQDLSQYSDYGVQSVGQGTSELIMGNEISQETCDKNALQIYKRILQHEPHILPDIGIDESLLKYSGPDSNAVLQEEFSNNEMLTRVPDYINSFGSALAALNKVPNAVGIGALVISLIVEIIIKCDTQTTDDDPYSLLRRVFGEEKASSVRDTMSEYLKRHRMYMKNNQLLREEIRRLEQQLSKDLTILRNSLLLDGQMSSRGFKIWVNGAAFHLQMLIHEARLEIQAYKPAADCVQEIEAAIDVYLRDLDLMLEKYMTYLMKVFTIKYVEVGYAYPVAFYYLRNIEIEQCSKIELSNIYRGPEFMTALMNLVYSKYEPINGLKSYFLNIKNNLNSRIHDRGSFTLSLV